MNNTLTTHIDTLADKMLTQYRQHQAAAQQHQAEQQKQMDQQDIAALQALLATELEPDLLAALSVTYQVRRTSSGRGQTEALFCYSGLDWHVGVDYLARASEKWHWSIWATQQGTGHQLHAVDVQASPQTLRTALLLKFAECREQAYQGAQEAAERQRKQKLAEAEGKAHAERAEQERAARIRQAEQEDAHWRSEIATLKSRALDTLWRWPEGITLTIYQITYTTAVGHDEDGESIIETESGWCSLDYLDSNGYIRIEASKTYSWSTTTDSRDIKLDPDHHMPIWQRFYVSCIEQVPRELDEDVQVSIPHVVVRRDSDADGQYRLAKVEDYSSFDEGPYHEPAGRIPLAWVRDLVDQAATS